MMGGRMQTCSFPKLKWSEISKCLNELGISISKDELTHPEEHKDSIRRMLEYLAELCTGTSREEWSQPGFAGLNAINYPELHEDSIPHLNSIRAIMKMMDICAVYDFAARDIVAPTSERLNRQLSGIINFCKFREERLMLLSELNGHRSLLLENLGQLQEKNDALNNRLTLLRNQTREEGEQILTMETDIRDMQAKIHELRRVQELQDRKIEQDSETYTKMAEKVEDSRATLESVLQEQKKLSGQVVTSPEKFRKQIIEVGQTLSHEQNDSKQAEKRIRHFSAWITNMDEAQSEVRLALEGIQDIRSEVEKQKFIITELDATKQTAMTLSASLSEVQQNQQQFARQAARMEDKLVALRSAASRRGEEQQKQTEVLHQQLVEAESFRVQVKSRAERMETEVKRVEKEFEAEAAVMEQDLADIQCAYQKLERKVVRHLQNFQKAMETTAVNGNENAHNNILSNHNSIMQGASSGRVVA
jgi:kinetochore protein Nuf2